MSRPNRDAVNRELTRLLNILLQQQPVHETPAYLTSALSQMRRSLMDTEHRQEIGGAARYPLPGWLEGRLGLGPYERYLLYRILDESEAGGVITVRGGSGSGKSSTFQHIESLSKVAAGEMAWHNPYHLTRFFFVVDLQTTSGRIYAMRNARSEDDGGGDGDAIEVLLRDLSGILDSVFTSHFDDVRFRRLVSDSVMFKPGREHYTTLESAQAHLQRILPPDAFAHYRMQDFIDTFDRLPEHERLSVRFLLFTQMARALEQEGRQLVLVLDNIDPLPVQVQNKLVNLLTTSVTSQIWKPLRVVILTRLSTAIHHMGTDAPNVIDHLSVSPPDVVLYRLMWFFLATGTFPTFVAQPDDLKAAVTSRLFELWRHLIDRRGTVRRLLAAMSGTNLRNAFGFAKAWCLSPRFTPEVYSGVMLKEFQRNTAIVFGVHLLSELDAALARLADNQFSDAEVQELSVATDIEPGTTAVDAFAERFATSVLTLLDDLYLLADRSAIGDSQIRHQACIVGRQLLTETLADGSTGDRVVWMLHLALSNAFRRLKPFPLVGGRPVARIFTDSFSEGLHLALADVAEVDRNRVERLMAWIVDTAEKALSSPITEASVARGSVVREGGAHVPVDRLHRAPFEPITSRFEAATILIDPESEDPTAGAGALNVLTLDRSKVAPAILRLLYLLATRGSATVRELYGDMLFHRFRTDEVYVALKRMAHTNARLIFAGLSDANDDLDPWLKSERSVYLSAAGRGYFKDVVASAPYLQWALADIAEVRAAMPRAGVRNPSSLADRIEAALMGFEVVVSAELAALKQTWEDDTSDRAGERMRQRSLSAEEVSCQSVTCDVFFRSYPSFIFALSSNFRRLTRASSTEGIARVRAVARRWQRTADFWLNQHADYFGYEYEFWRERVDLAAPDAREILEG